MPVGDLFGACFERAARSPFARPIRFRVAGPLSGSSQKGIEERAVTLSVVRNLNGAIRSVDGAIRNLNGAS